jgi:hypothetical protein
MPEHNPQQPLNRQDQRKLRNLAERAQHHPELAHYHRAWLLHTGDQLVAAPERTVQLGLDLQHLGALLVDVGVHHARAGRFSWAAIGEWLGVSRAAACNRYNGVLSYDLAVKIEDLVVAGATGR